MSMTLTACHAATPVTTDQDAKLLLQKYQQGRGLVIGQNYHGHLEYFDSLKSFDSRSAALLVDASAGTPKLEVPLVGGKKSPNPDAEWDVECREDHCAITNRNRTGISFSLEQKRLLTPIYWSPDGSFGFYVLKGPTWRTPARCSMEDERDIVLVDTASGTQGVVKTVCGGFPYDQLRWFILPK
jgi:hypothetical protein